LGERIDRLVALDPTELGVAESLIAEAGHEDPLQRARPALQCVKPLLIRVVTVGFG
jgi:hypothetical protein